MREFEPLLKAARPTLYQTNAFRVIGVAVDAETYEINRRVQKIEMAQKFGITEKMPSGILPLRSAPSLAVLQEARQKVSDPESRLIEEFFWLWPEEHHRSKEDLALQALQRSDLQSAFDIWLRRANTTTDTSAIHNLAVLFHMQALDSANTAGTDGSVPETLWIRAWKYWRTLVAYDPFWHRLSHRIEELDDPRLTPRISSQFRSTLVSAILQIDVSLAIAAAEAGQLAKASVHLKMAEESGFAADVIRHRTERSLLYVRSQIQNLCAEAERKVAEQIEQPGVILQILLSETKPRLEILNYLLGVGNQLRDGIHDQVAGTARNMLIAFGNKTENWIACQQLLEEIRPWAASESLRNQIAEDIETVRGNVTWKRVWAEVKPVSSAPTLTQQFRKV